VMLKRGRLHPGAVSSCRQPPTITIFRLRWIRSLMHMRPPNLTPQRHDNVVTTGDNRLSPYRGRRVHVNCGIYSNDSVRFAGD
jgi:hypothetical protein